MPVGAAPAHGCLTRASQSTMMPNHLLNPAPPGTWGRGDNRRNHLLYRGSRGSLA